MVQLTVAHDASACHATGSVTAAATFMVQEILKMGSVAHTGGPLRRRITELRSHQSNELSKPKALAAWALIEKEL